jgi:histidyl-tRNA synthetase
VQRLLQKAYRPDPTPALARAIEFIGRLRDAAGPPAEALPALRALLVEYELDDAPVREVEEAVQYFDAYAAAEAGPSESGVQINLSLARGLRYYNGLVFEVYDESGNQIAGGGRYDDLVRALGGRAPMPACGFSYGLERVVAALDRSGHTPEVRGAAEVLIVPLAGEDYAVAAALSTQLRQRGVSVELDPRFRGVKTSLRHADRIQIPFALLVGEEERATGEVVLRDMRATSQANILISEAADHICQVLGSEPK